jgi:hypothetical protein
MFARLGVTPEQENAAPVAPHPIADVSAAGPSMVRNAGKPRMRWSATAVEMFATLGLALSTLVAITAISIGIARADGLIAQGEADGAPLAIALFIGLLLSGMGGLTALMAQDRTPRG